MRPYIYIYIYCACACVQQPQWNGRAEYIYLKRVPAHRHPQIAPAEFADWLRTQSKQLHYKHHYGYDHSRPRRRCTQLSKSYTASENDGGDDRVHAPTAQNNTNDRAFDSNTNSYNTSDNKEENVDDDDASSSSNTSASPTSPRDGEPPIAFYKHDNKTVVFNRFSTSEDDSRVLVPRESRSLSRRSALSARGKKSKNRRTTHCQSLPPMPHRPPVPPDDPDDENRPLFHHPVHQAITLYDRPVNLSEWIDLGDASVAQDQQQQLHFPHQRRQNKALPPPPPPPPHLIEPRRRPLSEPHAEITATPPSPQTPPPEKASTLHPNTADEHDDAASKNGTKRRKSLRQAFAERRKRSNSASSASSTFSTSSSWFSSLFRKDTPPPVPAVPAHLTLAPQTPTPSSPSPPSTPKTGLSGLITRSLSRGKKKKKRMSKPPLVLDGPRLPMHVERAIYQISHSKLMNPRRPLYHQVLITNFMFWYLSLLQAQQRQQSQQHHYDPYHGFALSPSIQYHHQQPQFFSTGVPLESRPGISTGSATLN